MSEEAQRQPLVLLEHVFAARGEGTVLHDL